MRSIDDTLTYNHVSNEEAKVGKIGTDQVIGRTNPAGRRSSPTLRECTSKSKRDMSDAHSLPAMLYRPLQVQRSGPVRMAI